jgi:glycosyltransferase involved in cell wall biosynthesis
MTNMNILIITTRLNLGGIGVYVSSLAKGLAKKGHKVIVASSGGQLESVLTEAGIEHVHIPIDTSSEVGPHIMISVMKLLKVIKKENIQIIHAQTRVAQVIGHYLEKFSKAVFVTTCHGFFKRRLIRRLLPCWGKRVIAISDAVREHLINTMKVPKEQVELIYNGIDTGIIEENYPKGGIDNIKKEFNLSADLVIGITARLSSVKGHIYLLMAIPSIKKVFPNIQLLIVGSGEKRYERKLRHMCKKLNIEGNVVFHPGIQNIYKALSVMNVFVLPSIEEGLGLSLLEALAVGLPIVASNVGGVGSVIRHKENGILVSSKDHEALAEAIIALLKDRDYAKRLGQKGIQVIMERFTLDKMIDKVAKFYRTALESHETNINNRT